jgi:hypothetical protein
LRDDKEYLSDDTDEVVIIRDRDLNASSKYYQNKLPETNNSSKNIHSNLCILFHSIQFHKCYVGFSDDSGIDDSSGTTIYNAFHKTLKSSIGLRYPMRPASAVLVKDIEKLKRSTDDAFATILSKLNQIENENKLSSGKSVMLEENKWGHTFSDHQAKRL